MPVQAKPLPTAAELWESFDYKPLTGELVRKITTTGRGNRNTKVGSPNRHGYYRVSLQGESHSRARLTWKWCTGQEPERFIDHINRDRGDDRFWNLRDVDESGNMLNRSAYGQSQVVKESNRWRVARLVNGKRLNATFNTESEAIWYSKNLDARMNQLRHGLPNDI